MASSNYADRQIEGEDFSKLQSVRKALAGGEKSRSALKVAGRASIEPRSFERGNRP
jgi:hypothetical protein